MPAQQANNGQQQGQQKGGWKGMLGGAFRMLMFYFLITSFMKPKANVQAPSKDAAGNALPPHANIYSVGQPMEFWMFTSESASREDVDFTRPLIHEKDMTFDHSPSNERVHKFNMTLTEHLLNNGTLYAHAFLTKPGASPDAESPAYQPTTTVYKLHSLTKFLKKPKVSKAKNLIDALSKENATAPAAEVVASEPTESGEQPIVSFWSPSAYINFVADQTVFPAGNIPQPILEHFTLDPATNRYFPVVFFNDFWSLKEHFVQINSTLVDSATVLAVDENGKPALPIEITIAPLSMFKWQLYVQMDQSLSMQQNMGSMGDGDRDEFKRMLLETNPVLLGVTVVVSMFHMLFDFLAFKNDIKFWKDTKSMEGLSVRSMFFNTFSQVIIFLYLLDNETSWMVLISSGIGCVIEMWKVTKAMKVTVDRSGPIPKLKFEDRDSYTSETKEADIVATKYLGYALYVLVAGTSVYSLVYETHKSWYSWILSSLVSAIYTFGFLLMTPQLFLNYKLKSVAHLPWKTFVYKALNTFIDDLFAFIIKMPTLHRLSCFRDDLIFLIFLYQRWIYPVDKKRVNEFGQSGEDAEPSQEQPADSAAPAAPKPIEEKKND